MLFEEKVITPKALAELLEKVFIYPLLDLRYYPRNHILTDVLTEEQMLQNRCVPIFRRGCKVYLAVSDPTQIQNFQKIAFSSGFSIDLVVVCDDQLGLETFQKTLLLKVIKGITSLEEVLAHTND